MHVYFTYLTKFAPRVLKSQCDIPLIRIIYLIRNFRGAKVYTSKNVYLLLATTRKMQHSLTDNGVD